MNGSPCSGVIVPIVTPFDQNGAIDRAAVRRIIDYLASSNVSGIFILGTIGEGPSIPAADKPGFVEAAVAAAAGRMRVYVNISDNSLQQMIDLAGHCGRLGASGVAAYSPFYYPVSNGEIEQFFLHLADRSPLPLLVYNMPRTTRISIPIDIVARLAKHPNIAGIKDSENNAERMTQMLPLVSGRPDFSVLAASGAIFGHALRAGAHGLIPGTANLHPAPYVAMCQAAAKAQWEDVDRFQRETEALTAEYQKDRNLAESMAMLKALMARRGLCSPVMLPPITTIHLK